MKPIIFLSKALDTITSVNVRAMYSDAYDIVNVSQVENVLWDYFQDPNTKPIFVMRDEEDAKTRDMAILFQCEYIIADNFDSTIAQIEELC